MKMTKEHQGALWITQAAVIAALYVVLTLVFAPIAFGTSGIDLRISECLTILPMFTPAAIPGLFIGCVIANILGGAVLWDIIFGSVATLIGAAVAYLLRHNRWLVPVPTIAANTIIVPLVLRYAYGVNLPMIALFGTVFIGEVLGCYVLGEILAAALLPIRRRIFNTI
jgi:uncharacterized membrane protein